MKRYNDYANGEMVEDDYGAWVLYDEVTSHISALEAKCAELEQQLASMTAERDSESRWAKQYHDEAVALREQLDAEQERINEPEEGAQ